ncbi:hypothetical protein B7W85_00890 [Allorhizobium ampelinum]|nr:hypothetical protein BBL07_01535 [Agrobacterium vitis]OVE97918.1 hypothetical protein B7W85_00890 [Allorhizobium ampelinum]
MIALLLLHHFAVSFTAKFLRIGSFVKVLSFKRTGLEFSRKYMADENVKRRAFSQTKGILTFH